MEYTLVDAYESLKDSLMERQKQAEDLTSTIFNNEPVALKESCSSKDVKRKQHELCQTLSNQILQEVPKDIPVPKTSDLHVQAITELEQEVENAQKLFDSMKAQLSDIKDDISSLENKKVGLEKMKEAYRGASEMIANTTYDRECAIAKRMFRTVKADLHMVVEELFPGNEASIDLLAELTSAYTKGGDDLYVEVTPDVLDFANFLIEEGIITYHRNDKSKVRLMDM